MIRRPGLLASFLLLARPGITALVVMAGFSGMALAGRGLPDAGTAAVCMVVLVLGATGSVMLNSVLEYSLDCRMERLHSRTGALERLGRRLIANLGMALVLSATVIAYRFLTPISAALTLVAAAWYLVLYTMGHKRRSPFGAVTGGVPGALPALIGYGAVNTSIGADGMVLFLLILLWQPPHFWLLSLRYRDDYRAAGLPVLPLVHGEPFALAAIFIYVTSLLPVSLALWFFGYCSGAYAVAALLFGIAHLAVLCSLLVLRPDYAKAFRATNWYLTGLLLVLVCDLCL